MIVRSDGLLWLKPVAMVLFMLCSAVSVEWLLLKPCCVEIFGILFVIYGSSVFSSVFAIIDCHVTSMGSTLAFRADSLGFESRSGLTRHIQCSVD